MQTDTMSEIRERLLEFLEYDAEASIVSLNRIVEQYRVEKGLESVNLGSLALNAVANLRSLVMCNEAAPATTALDRNLVRKLDGISGGNASRLLEESIRKHESWRNAGGATQSP